MRWWAVTAAGVAIAGALAWSLVGRGRAVQTGAVPPAPPGTVIVTTVSEDGEPFTIAVYGLSRLHARGFELVPEAVSAPGERTETAREQIQLPVPGGISRVWVATKDGRVACSDPIDPHGLRRLRITIPPRRFIQVTVVDGEGGGAVSGARVMVEPLREGGVPLGSALVSRWNGFDDRALRTDSAGRVRVPAPPGGGAYLSTVSRDGLRRIAVVRALAGERVTLRLPPAPKQQPHLMGKLRWPDGSLAAGAIVGIERVDGTNAGFGREHVDEKGSFAIGVPLEPGRYRVLGYRRNRFGWRLEGVAETGVKRGDATIVDLRLQPSDLQALLYLRFTQGGRPIDRSRLSVSRGEQGSWAWAGSGVTREHGEAFVYVRRAPHYLLRVEPHKQGKRPRYALIDAPPDRQPLDVSLDAQATITLTRPTVDSLGHALGTIRLFCSPDPARPLAGFEVEDFDAAEGTERVVIPNVPPGRYQIWMEPANSSGFRDWHRWCGIDIVTGDQAVVLPAPPERGCIRGRVLDAQGRPVTGAGVWISFGTAHMSRRNAAYIQPDGLFECTDVPPGPAQLTAGVAVPGGDATVCPPRMIDLEPGETRWIDIRLP